MEEEGLDRFVEMQADSYAGALAELWRGRKESHWMWFIFPQIAGLGHSDMSRRFAIRNMDEARRYLAHPILGPRLAECTAVVLTHRGVRANAIFGSVDALKFHSSMTLFDAAAGASEPRFGEALDAFYGGARDPATLRLLA